MQSGVVGDCRLSMSPIGKRPVVLLSRDEAYSVRNSVTIAEVTSTIRNIPVEVNLGKEEGLPKKCGINLDTIITIRKELLTERIAYLDSDKIDQVNKAIKFALDIK